MSRTIVLFLLLSCCALTGCADAGGFVDEELVDSTCAEALCGWETRAGALVPSASWHEHQRAIELADVPTRITRKISGTPNVPCLTLNFLAEIESDAQLEVQLDYNDDGSIDSRSFVPALRWRKTSVPLRTPSEYRSLRITLERQGAGAVRIATLRLTSDRTACVEKPPTALSDGALCSIDQTCASGRCVLGHCARCGAEGCEEGELCRASDECRDGACAAGICRACAKRGDCAAGLSCSVPGQCAGRSCNQAALPSTTAFPGEEGTCGSCATDAECPGAFCVLGRCAGCRTIEDCASGQVCAYDDTLEASHRACRSPFTSIVPRGGLCEVDADCVTGLRCGAAHGRAKRCGISCAVDGDCGANGVCASTGATRSVVPPARVALLSGWQTPSERITTCYQRVASSLTGIVGPAALACEVQDQCITGTACCNGTCEIGRTFDPDLEDCKPLKLDGLFG
ncbi:MAG: hypothetical protein RLZZ450_582 [Pseudomonadota bacterium]|jgi:hypothetical protein